MRGAGGEVTGPQRVGAWVVHLLTASGAVVGLVALDAVVEGEVRRALVWMAVAVLIDGVDGTLARWFRPERATPGFDGALLDNIVDYLNYVVVPAFFLWRAELVPEGMGLAAAAAMTLASAYQFCQRQAKTPDHFFKGFPSYWNVVVLYLLVGGLAPTWNLLIVVLLCCGVFLPLRWIYPSRMTRWRRLTLLSTALWSVAIAAVIHRYPSPPTWLVVASLVYVVYYVAVSLYLSLAGPPGKVPEEEVADQPSRSTRNSP